VKALTNKLLVGLVSAVSALALAAPPAFASISACTYTSSPASVAVGGTQIFSFDISNGVGADDIDWVRITPPATHFQNLNLAEASGWSGSTAGDVATYTGGAIAPETTSPGFIATFDADEENPHSAAAWLVQASDTGTSTGAVTCTPTSGGTVAVTSGAPEVGASISEAVSAINPTPEAMFSQALDIAPFIAMGILVVFFLVLLRGLVSGLNKGKTKLSVGYGAGPERTDLTKGIKSGKYHG